ncbi:MAG TPA: MFS transporter [Sphingomonas sp.]|jgi:predicted MFS family arabinose efflux permease
MAREDASPEVMDEAPSASRYGYSIALLTTIYLFNFVDRQIVNIVAEPIKREFGLADWQLGAMTGLSFAILYTLCGFPVARLAERGDRSRLIALAVVGWSLFTALCGLAQTFTQFVLARIGVGLGEAGCTPPAHSLISDIVPQAKRASALALYSMGAPMGQLVGMAMGGFAAAEWGWRSVFFIAGAPGVLLAVLAILTLPEPRRAHGHNAATRDEPEPFWRVLRLFLTNRSFMLVAGGGAAASFVFYGLGAFYASFFLRNHAGQLAQAAAGMGVEPIGFLGLALGLSSGIAGVAGAVVGGRVADAWAARNGSAYVLLPALCSAVAAPLLLAAMFVPGLYPSIALIALASALNSAWNGAAYAAALGLAPPRSRATASALMLFVFNIVGLGLGPLCVGLLSDAFAPSLGTGGGLRVGMAGATAAGLVAAACFWAARGRLQRDRIA